MAENSCGPPGPRPHTPTVASPSPRSRTMAASVRPQVVGARKPPSSSRRSSIQSSPGRRSGQPITTGDPSTGKATPNCSSLLPSWVRYFTSACERPWTPVQALATMQATSSACMSSRTRPQRRSRSAKEKVGYERPASSRSAASTRALATAAGRHGEQGPLDGDDLPERVAAVLGGEDPAVEEPHEGPVRIDRIAGDGPGPPALARLEALDHAAPAEPRVAAAVHLGLRPVARAEPGPRGAGRRGEQHVRPVGMDHDAGHVAAVEAFAGIDE